jgi:hypothetical protein
MTSVTVVLDDRLCVGNVGMRCQGQDWIRKPSNPGTLPCRSATSVATPVANPAH